MLCTRISFFYQVTHMWKDISIQPYKLSKGFYHFIQSNSIPFYSIQFQFHSIPFRISWIFIFIPSFLHSFIPSLANLNFLEQNLEKKSQANYFLFLIIFFACLHWFSSSSSYHQPDFILFIPNHWVTMPPSFNIYLMILSIGFDCKSFMICLYYYYLTCCCILMFEVNGENGEA